VAESDGGKRWQTASVTHVTTPEPSEQDEVELEDDDVVVLPWWQHPVNIVTMLVAVALIAGMLGWLIGQSDDEAPPSNAADVGFLQDMRIHHDQAIEMANLYLDRPDIDGSLGTIARGIAYGQSIEIGIMVQLLNDLDAPAQSEDGTAMAWMGMAVPAEEMPGMATEDQVVALGDAEGGPADDLFVELMVAHHEGGIEMMDAALAGAENPTVLFWAQRWRDAQVTEISEMETQLARSTGAD
jgi:uncharacterized protein (DUF305 family)